MGALIRVDTRAAGETSVWMWCPGCGDAHRVVVGGANGWGWNGSVDAPTFTPSILVRGGSRNVTCHSFVTDGAWHYLGDCTHPLAGQTVPMAPLPDWLT